jgi:hypothetical protein
LVGSISIAGEGGAGIGVWPIADGDPAWLVSARNVSAEPVSAPDGMALVGSADYDVVARGANAAATNGRLTCPIQPTLRQVHASLVRHRSLSTRGPAKHIVPHST